METNTNFKNCYEDGIHSSDMAKLGNGAFQVMQKTIQYNGGVGTIPGILIGVLVFEVLKIVLQFLGVESSYTYVAQGLVIIIAVALDLRKYLAKK